MEHFQECSGIMKGFFVFFIATSIFSVALARYKSIWDIQRQLNTSVAPSSRIIRGTPARNGDFPYQVRVTIFGGTIGMGWCGGSIIAPNWVLTAGHCATYRPPLILLDYIVFYLEAGSVTANEPEQDTHVQLTNAHAHPDYNPNTLQNDIAVLKTDKAFVFNSPNVGAISLVAANTNPTSYVGQLISVSGFGYTSNDGPSSSALMYTKNLRVISFSDCKMQFSDDVLPTSSFCVQDSTLPISSVCSGDSGSPVTLIISGILRQIGVVSYGSEEGCDTAAQGMTSVAQFVPWIRTVTRLPL